MRLRSFSVSLLVAAAVAALSAGAAAGGCLKDTRQTKVDQIRDTGAEIVMAPCHNCRDQIMKGLGGEFKKGTPGFDMGNYKETVYLWELVANTLVIEPWSEAEIEKAHALRDAQFERDGIEFEEEE